MTFIKDFSGEPWGRKHMYTHPQYRFSPYAIGILLSIIIEQFCFILFKFSMDFNKFFLYLLNIQ